MAASARSLSHRSSRPRAAAAESVARTGAPGACFVPAPDIWYWPSMTAMLARSPCPSGVSVKTVEIAVPMASVTYLSTSLFATPICR